MNYLSHQTTFKGLLNILNSNQILNINELKKEYPNFKGSSEDSNSIFFTPIFNEKFIFENKKAPVLYLDLEKILNIYGQYYINSANSFKPLDGTPNRKGSCKCRNTYHNNLDYSIFEEFENSSANACYKNKDEILQMFFNFQNEESTTLNDVLNECDGGPEFAIVTPNISLNGVLKYVVLPNRNYLINNNFIKFQDITIEGNGKIEKINNYFDHCKNVTEILGGIFIELPIQELKGRGKLLKIKNKKTKIKEKLKKSKKLKKIKKTKKIIRTKKY